MTGEKPPGITVSPAGADPLDAAVEISIRITNAGMSSHSDSYLAMLWHAIQAAPADFEHQAVGNVAEHIGREIIRRWLRGAEPELWHQQGGNAHWKALTTFAKWNGQQWVMSDDAFQAELDRRNQLDEIEGGETAR